MSRLQAEVVALVPAAGRYADLAAAWLTEARAEIFPDFDPPGRAVGTLEVRRDPVLVGGSEEDYSDRAWRRLLGSLASQYPFHVQLLMDALDEHGQATRPDRGATVGVHRNHGQPEWVTFEIEGTIGVSGSTEPAAVRPYPGELKWAEFVKRWAIRASACYAHVSDDTEVIMGTALEQATARDAASPWVAHIPEETVPRSPRGPARLLLGDRVRRGACRPSRRRGGARPVGRFRRGHRATGRSGVLAGHAGHPGLPG